VTRSYNTQVGLGTEHQAQRRQAITRLRPGIDTCAHPEYCGGLPMWPTPKAAVAAGVPAWLGRLDLDHWPGRIFGGPQHLALSHSTCNRRAGAAMGNRLRGMGIRRTVRRRPTGRDYNRQRRARW
jgi:hypothetical protein